jgi:hypothetical protein
LKKNKKAPNSQSPGLVGYTLFSDTPPLGGFAASSHCLQFHRVVGFCLVVQYAEGCFMTIVPLNVLHTFIQQKSYGNMAINIMCIFGGGRVFHKLPLCGYCMTP